MVVGDFMFPLIIYVDDLMAIKKFPQKIE